MSIAARYAQLRPKDPQAWLHWAWLVDQQGQPWGSSGLLRQGFEHNPGSLELGVALAEALIHEDKDSEAYETLEALRSQHGKAPDPLVLMARLAFMANNKTEAERILAVAVDRINPKKPADAAFEIGALYALLGRQDQAIVFLDTVEKRSFRTGPHLLLAVLRENRDPISARKHLAAARYYWEGPRSELAELLEQARDLYA